MPAVTTPSQFDNLKFSFVVRGNSRKRIGKQINQLILGGVIKRKDLTVVEGVWTSHVDIDGIPRWAADLLG